VNRPNQDQKVGELDEAIQRFLDELHYTRFFGIVELHYQDGNLVRVKKQEVFQPKDLLK
jgi:hypothetical protein